MKFYLKGYQKYQMSFQIYLIKWLFSKRPTGPMFSLASKCSYISKGAVPNREKPSCIYFSLFHFAVNLVKVLMWTENHLYYSYTKKSGLENHKNPKHYGTFYHLFLFCLKKEILDWSTSWRIIWLAFRIFINSIPY